MLSLATISEPLQRDDLPTGSIAGLYVHVPFCFHKCHYCDFYSITRQSEERMGRFVDLVLREAAMWRESRGILIPRTVFFGGGTPSLLPIEQMRRLLQGLKEIFDLVKVNEWTIECNPATVTGEYLSMLHESGVNRISFGAQSFDRRELSVLERHHDPEDVPRSVELAQRAGFERLNLDLIYAIPGQEMETWLASLEQALGLRTTHLSCYGLTYEANTPMAVKKRLGHFQAVEESVELAMLHATRRRLIAAGLPPYEISNYAAPGEACRHNLVYWNGENYLGLGPSAASHLEGVRWKNRPHLGEWESRVADGELATIEVERLSPLRRAGELAYLQLRLMRGIEYADFAKRTGRDAQAMYGDIAQRLAQNGLLEVDAAGFRLSERGIDVADAIAAEFLSAM